MFHWASGKDGISAQCQGTERRAGREIQNVLECSRGQMWILDHGAKGETCEEKQYFFIPFHTFTIDAGSVLTFLT